MDSYCEHPSEFEPPFAGAEDSSGPAAVDIGTDERRMHVRAYNYWASLLHGRDYPSIEDLEPGDLRDFAPHSVLLDFTSGRENPATAFIGEAIRAECGLGADVQTSADVPSRSLLSRLTDHYMQIIANRAPVGFEAEFVNQRGDSIRYRGILMPLSSDGDSIDFIYGVINWKTAEQGDEGAVHVRPLACWTDHEQRPEVAGGEDLAVELGEDAGLGDRLWAARECAEVAKAAEGRSRTALYRALSHAYDLAIASHRDAQGFAELLDESGVKPQARAPMTAIAKLVFGIDYDKARLTEFAAALSFAHRQQLPIGSFLALVEAQAGGLKALVAAERQARRPNAKAGDGSEVARSRLRQAPPLERIESDEEFALVLTRRAADGTREAVAMVDDPALVERAIRRAAA